MNVIIKTSKVVLCQLLIQLVAQTNAAFTSHVNPLVTIPTLEQGLSTQSSKPTISTPTSLNLKMTNSNGNDTTSSPSSSSSLSETATPTSTSTEEKEILLNYLSKVTPNQSTSKSLTDDILTSVSNLEPLCPTNIDSVLTELNGNWELIWTAQDTRDTPIGKVQNWINPLENQAYSINPLSASDNTDESNNDDSNKNSSGGRNRNGMGRSNPLLPQNIQNKLEDIGLLVNSDDDDKSSSTAAVSSQAIDIRRGRVRNVVSVLVKNPIPFPNPGRKTVRGSVTVDVNFKPNNSDKRKIDVKFDECRFVLQNSPLDVKIPLGPIGPTGECLASTISICH